MDDVPTVTVKVPVLPTSGAKDDAPDRFVANLCSHPSPG